MNVIVTVVVAVVVILPSPQRYRSPHLEAEVRNTKTVFNNCRGYRFKVSLIMIWEGGINNNVGGPKWDSMTLKSHGRVTSHIFMKEPEGSSEKILKYTKCTHLRISIPSQKT